MWLLKKFSSTQKSSKQCPKLSIREAVEAVDGFETLEAYKKFRLVALNPFLAFSLIFSNNPSTEGYIDAYSDHKMLSLNACI